MESISDVDVTPDELRRTLTALRDLSTAELRLLTDDLLITADIELTKNLFFSNCQPQSVWEPWTYEVTPDELREALATFKDLTLAQLQASNHFLNNIA